MSAIITSELVALDVNLGTTPPEVVQALAAKMTAAGRATDQAQLVADVLAREAQSPTGQFAGIAIPHCRSEAVTEASLGFARLTEGADFGAADKAPSDLIFMIAAPAGGGDQHLVLLTALARALVRPEFTEALRGAKDADEVVRIVSDVVSPPAETTAAATTGAATAAASASAGATDAAATASAPAAASTATAEKPRLILGITACPTGIAHTYMAAESLENMGKELGVDVRIETQGSSATTPFPADVIAAADAVIFATEVGVKGRERFAGLPVIESGVKRAINEPRQMIEEAVAASQDPSSRRVSGDSGASTASNEAAKLGFGTKVRQVLLTGVSYMIPFVAAGGLLMAIGFLIGGFDVAGNYTDNLLSTFSLSNLPQGTPVVVDGVEKFAHTLADGTAVNLTHTGLALYLGTVLFKIGNLAIAFLVPALSGYIAFGIADRPGIAPGFLGGAIAVFTGAGFIGGIVTGLLAGLAAYWISTWNVPRWMRGLMPVMIIPLLSSLFVGGLMLLFLGAPLASLTKGLENSLNGMTGSSAILLGIILGLMMAFDLGGPVNKAAYSFATAGLAAATVATPAPWYIMAAVMGAGMVPPLAMGLATLLRPKLFTKVERENGISAIPLGLCFISEGAIPFAASDPFRVIPSMMVGAAVTGGMLMGSQVELKAPHGGLAVIFAISPWYTFLLALVLGTVISAVAVIAAKTIFKPKVALAA
ncbi:PTS sugar transporter subunit IIA [Micrococcales bacterium 31B]|nr:PTS sugar transporter subunit IIA [Micrococcales bacterium 31B]